MENTSEFTIENKYLQAFQELVIMKYKLYNGLFVTLPFEYLQEVGIELPVFAELCQSELAKGISPEKIVQHFFSNVVHTKDLEKKIKSLILTLQFVERQIVLFDALEDAAYAATHDMQGQGSLNFLINQAINSKKTEQLRELLQTYRTRIVLTAHPTQFYPPQVLTVIQDLTEAIAQNDIKKIHDLLLQLGMTPFKREHKPSPIDEAEILMQYLVQVFYPVLKNIHYSLAQVLYSEKDCSLHLPAIIELGFWPGGDRDGNPFVTAEATLEVAKKLKINIINLYIQEIKELEHRFTFRQIWDELEKILDRLEMTQYHIISEKKNSKKYYKNCQEFKKDLIKVHDQVIANNYGLFIEKINQLLGAIQIFGFHFASIDLRQDSHVHVTVLQNILNILIDENLLTNLTLPTKPYSSLSNNEKITLLEKLISAKTPSSLYKKLSDIKKDHSLMADVLDSLKAARKIQEQNGEQGLHRYVISHTESAANILEVLLFAHWSEWPLEELNLDIVPLFESIDDLKNADAIMQELYENPVYKKHLKHRDNRQTVMLGFSDGTKDGGYVTANWQIFQCKKHLAELSEKYQIEIIFFDGRGGPPARGGGNTHQFYRALENNIDQKQIQLTIQGQTISTMYGTKISAAYNVEQLFTAKLLSALFPDPENKILTKQSDLLEALSEASYRSYSKLKNDPLFIPYLEQVTPLNYYGDLNIASRPPRRQPGSLKFEDLRAIPFVGAWSQMRQNVPGYYGLGTALKTLSEQGKKNDLKELYQHSLYFRTLMENAMQSLDKSFFQLTRYLEKDKQFGKFWHKLYDEAELATDYLKKITEQKELLENEPIIQQSVKMREEIVLPLLVIQQYALIRLRQLAADKQAKSKEATIFKKILLKSLAANINANRESA